MNLKRIFERCLREANYRFENGEFREYSDVEDYIDRQSRQNRKDKDDVYESKKNEFEAKLQNLIFNEFGDLPNHILQNVMETIIVDLR